MTDSSELLAALTSDVVRWLEEEGVRGADESTAISSLDLTWLLHCFEESTGRAWEFDDEELAKATSVRALVDLFEHSLLGAEG